MAQHFAPQRHLVVMTHIASDVCRREPIQCHIGLLRRLKADPSCYIEEVSGRAGKGLALKTTADDVVACVPLTVEALQALIDLMTIGALERCNADPEAPMAYRLAGARAD